MASSSRAMISLLGKFPHYLAKTIKQNHPVSWTGILLHTMRWLEARSSQLILPNPGFNPQAGKSVAIYCVHGTADRELSFLTMANQLIKLKLPECIKHIVLVNFKNRATGAGIEEDYQEQLLQQILANGDDHVVVMGHSRGGIIASSFAEFCAAKNNIKVEMVVPICAPFGGSYLALDVLAYFSKSVEEMQIGSEFLERLKKAVEQSDYRYYFFEAGRDWIVLEGCATVSGYKHSDANQKLPDHGHISIMTSGTLSRIIHSLFKKHFEKTDFANIRDQKLINNMVSELIKQAEQEPERPSPGLFDFEEEEILDPKILEKICMDSSERIETIMIGGNMLIFHPDYYKITKEEKEPVEKPGLFDF